MPAHAYTTPLVAKLRDAITVGRTCAPGRTAGAPHLETQTVTAVATAELLKTADASVGEVVDSERIVEAEALPHKAVEMELSTAPQPESRKDIHRDSLADLAAARLELTKCDA